MCANFYQDNYWDSNETCLKIDFAILLAFKDFCIEFKVKDCTPRAFTRYKFYLYLTLYPESYVELMAEQLLMADGYLDYSLSKKREFAVI